ncbi:FkbM family methyltransferase [Streptomyces sp. NPDC002088]|uniref:FkbM family methyltransferase n=1 Tax=Streptomyces sp. NPDC002088 TaxID=3154665 RepID=UPI0033238AC7
MNLVFDIGMKDGEDSALYLAKGFHVVAFEADPVLIQQAHRRFEKEIRSGRLHLVEGAIVPESWPAAPDGKVRFYRNPGNSDWGTVLEEWTLRNQVLGFSRIEEVEVDAVDLAAQIRKFGVPHYMKIDIEGVDLDCLNTLAQFDQRPEYVSIESEKRSFAALEEELEALSKLGYQSFKAVQQGSVHRQHEPLPAREGEYSGYTIRLGSSGLFGRDLPGTWKTRDEVLRQYRRIFWRYRLLGDYSFLGSRDSGRWLLRNASALLERLGLDVPRPVPGWFDTHARHVDAAA